MKKLHTRLIALLIISASPASILAQGPYWATDVAPIFYANCTKCHNPNGIAPFSLMTYDDAVSVAGYIKTAVSNRIMPPWPPDSSYTRFAHERILSQQDIQTIVDWVDNGVDSGNMALAPTPPIYNSIATITNPNLTIQMPFYIVNAAEDLYRCFVFPSNLTTDEFVTKVEVLPGNRSIVHHALIFQDTSSTCLSLDSLDPASGYTSFGGVGSNTASLITGWVPGQGAYELPANMGIRLLANTNLILQIHYPAGTFNAPDSTQVRFTFANGIVRDVYMRTLVNHNSTLTNGPLYIPANTSQTFYSERTTPIEGTIIAVAPHMHLIGRNIRSYAIDPNGDTIPFIYIPNWQFHWQGIYTYRQALRVPAGSIIYAEVQYDNTSANPYNPYFPPVDIGAGESTTDEMMLVYFAFLNYLPGDENIILDSTIFLSTPEPTNSIIQTAQLYTPYPQPALGFVTLEYYLPESGPVSLELIDMMGRSLKVWLNHEQQNAGAQQLNIDVSTLSPGNYFIRLLHNGSVKTKPLIKN